MKELPNQAYDEIDPKTVMGHVHFHVGNIKDGQEYFIDTIHYDVVMSYGQGSALFCFQSRISPSCGYECLVTRS